MCRLSLVLIALLVLGSLGSSRAFEEGDAPINSAECLKETDADSLKSLGTDIAQIKFNVQANFAGASNMEDMYSLYATNDNCFKCSKTLVMHANSSGCALMYTTFAWTFVVLDTTNNVEYSSLSMYESVGEHGVYNITAIGSTSSSSLTDLQILTEVEPDEPLLALIGWICVFIAVIFFSFFGEQLYKNCHKQWVQGGLQNVRERADESRLEDEKYFSVGDDGSTRSALLTPGTPGTPGVDATWASKESFSGSPPNNGDVESSYVESSSPLTIDVVDMPGPGVVHRPPKSGTPHPVAPRNPSTTQSVSTPSSGTSGAKGGKDKDKNKNKAPSGRVDCLDTFRGMCLGMMIFVNYGGGGYWFFDHAAWNGLTFADILFPWFMWVMGCSMALSYKKLHMDELRGDVRWDVYEKDRALELEFDSAMHSRAVSTSGESPLGAGQMRIASAEGSPGWKTVRPVTPDQSRSSSKSESDREAGTGRGRAGSSGSNNNNTVEQAYVAPNGPNKGNEKELWYRVIRRSFILFMIGLFLNNGFDVVSEGRWRIPGVLQYFAISSLVVAGTVIALRSRTAARLATFEEQNVRSSLAVAAVASGRPPAFIEANAEFLAKFAKRDENKFGQETASPVKSVMFAVPGSSEHAHPIHEEAFDYTKWEHWFSLLDIRTSVMWCYRDEYLVMLCIFIVYLSVCLWGKAPGCPRGYNGPGGRGEDYGDSPECTGGIHKYIDMQIFGINHFYGHPTCQTFYDCGAYDPEGFWGSLTACTLTYTGLLTGRILLHYKAHTQRLFRFAGMGSLLLFIGGCLCGFSQNEGLVPVNKNLWSASFGLVMGGGGCIALGITYVLVDMKRLWSGAPFRYLGLNSILIYISHDIFQEYFPLSWSQNNPTHFTLLTMNIVGASMWVLVSYICYQNKFFLKI